MTIDQHIITLDSIKITEGMINRGIHRKPGRIMTTLGILHLHRNETFRE